MASSLHVLEPRRRTSIRALPDPAGYKREGAPLDSGALAKKLQRKPAPRHLDVPEEIHRARLPAADVKRWQAMVFVTVVDFLSCGFCGCA